MASNALVFFAGVGTTVVFLTAGFGSGLIFTKAAFDDKPIPSRADSRKPLPVRVILPAYGEPMPAAASVPAQLQTDEPPVTTAQAEPPRDTSALAAKVSAAETKVEPFLKAKRPKQAERKARKLATAKARQEMIRIQNRQEPGIMAFGGDGHFLGN
jgi:hypothetical protein